MAKSNKPVIDSPNKAEEFYEEMGKKHLIPPMGYYLAPPSRGNTDQGETLPLEMVRFTVSGIPRSRSGAHQSRSLVPTSVRP